MNQALRCPDHCRRGFSLLELLAVLTVIALLVGTFVPYAMNVRENARRVTCQANLFKIGVALREYAKQNEADFTLPLPRVRFDPAKGDAWTAFTGPDASSPFAAESAVAPNDVTASLWLLIREGFLPDAKAFVCPSSSGDVDELLDETGNRVAPKMRSNFRAADNLTYGFASPFSSIEDYRLNDTLPARFAVMADIGPGADAYADRSTLPGSDASLKLLRRLNSPNHRGRANFVLYGDSTVRMVETPYVGVGKGEDGPGDNIYTALADKVLIDAAPAHDGPGYYGPSIGPAYRWDSYLVPGAGFKP
jgi:prepilin-type N-terminal cleavage/methylation domain-containing protein